MYKGQAWISHTIKNYVSFLSGSLCVFFLLVAILCFIFGCDNILTRNNLKNYGIEVEVTVTDVYTKQSGDNLVDYYEFTYSYNGETVCFVDSPDHSYTLGQKFIAHIDPEEPKILVLPNSYLFFSFLMLVFAFASLFIYEGFRFLVVYIRYAILVGALAMVITGVLLPYMPLVVVGALIAVVAVGIMLWMDLRKWRKRRRRVV